MAPLGVFNREVFHRHAYVGRMAVVGADIGRTLGLMADWWAPSRRGEWRGGWSLGLRGWGIVTQGAKARWSAAYGRPWLFVRAAGEHGTTAAFGYPRNSPEGERRGVWVPGPSGRDVPYRGTFVDVIGPGFAFDGVDSSELDDHLQAWGMAPAGAPYACRVNAKGAAMARSVVQALHALTTAVDEEASRWG